MKLDNYSNKWWRKRGVKREIALKTKKILLLKLDEDYEIEKEGQKNLLAVDDSNNIIWFAGLPTQSYDSYYDMWFENGILFGRSSNSHIAEINPDTGKILKKYMVK